MIFCCVRFGTRNVQKLYLTAFMQIDLAPESRRLDIFCKKWFSRLRNIFELKGKSDEENVTLIFDKLPSGAKLWCNSKTPNNISELLDSILNYKSRDLSGEESFYIDDTLPIDFFSSR